AAAPVGCFQGGIVVGKHRQPDLDFSRNKIMPVMLSLMVSPVTYWGDNSLPVGSSEPRSCPRTNAATSRLIPIDGPPTISTARSPSARPRPPGGVSRGVAVVAMRRAPLFAGGEGRHLPRLGVLGREAGGRPAR